MHVDLSAYNNSWFDPGRGMMIRALWYFLNVGLMQNTWIPSSRLKEKILRIFGARIGKGVCLKPNINIKYPWQLEIGDFSWIGEKAWLDTLSSVKIGNHVCISQGAYLCTGNHNWADPAFGLVVKPIAVEDGAWIGAQAIVLPGVTVAAHSVVTAGSVLGTDTEPCMVYGGNPAVKIKERKIL